MKQVVRSGKQLCMRVMQPAELRYLLSVYQIIEIEPHLMCELQ